MINKMTIENKSICMNEIDSDYISLKLNPLHKNINGDYTDSRYNALFIGDIVRIYYKTDIYHNRIDADGELCKIVDILDDDIILQSLEYPDYDYSVKDSDILLIYKV
jgi:hypothetical protein